MKRERCLVILLDRPLALQTFSSRNPTTSSQCTPHSPSPMPKAGFCRLVFARDNQRFERYYGLFPTLRRFSCPGKSRKPSQGCKFCLFPCHLPHPRKQHKKKEGLFRFPAIP